MVGVRLMLGECTHATYIPGQDLWGSELRTFSKMTGKLSNVSSGWRMHQSCTSNLHPSSVDMVAAVVGRGNCGLDAVDLARLPPLEATVFMPTRGVT